MSILKWPVSERPRERLARLGGASLSTTELLAILIRTGQRGNSALTLAQKLLVAFGGLGGVSRATVRELCSIAGIGFSKAVSLKAAIELSRRISKENPTERIVLNSSEAVQNLYMEEMLYKDRETLIALHLDTKKQLISEEIVSVGTLNSSLVHPREIFRHAIKNGADSLILLHNHPSGDPTPSTEDLQVTQRLQLVGELLQIPLIDHLIFGDRKVQSVLGSFPKDSLSFIRSSGKS